LPSKPSANRDRRPRQNADNRFGRRNNYPGDKAINEMELEIENLSLKLLALHQPLAAELRCSSPRRLRINIEIGADRGFGG